MIAPASPHLVGRRNPLPNTLTTPAMLGLAAGAISVGAGALTVGTPPKILVGAAFALALVVLLDDRRSALTVLLFAIVGRVVTDGLGVSSVTGVAGSAVRATSAALSTSSPYTGYFDALFVLVGVAVFLRKGAGATPVLLGALLLFGYWNAQSNFPLDTTLVKEAERSAALLAVYVAARGLRLDEATLRRLLRIMLIVPGYALVQLLLHPSQRAESFLAHPNSAASLLAVLVVGCMWLRWFTEGGLPLWTVVIYALGLAATRSFGGLIAACAAVLVGATIHASSRHRSAVPMFAVLLLFAVGYAGSPLGSQRIAELANTTSPSQALSGDVTNSFDWRLRKWQLLIQQGLKKPVAGYGLGTTTTDVDTGGNLPHSDLVRLFVEFGLLGLFVVGALLVALAVRAWRAWLLSRAPGAVLCLLVIVAVVVNAVASNEFAYTTTMVAALTLFAAGRSSLGRPPTGPRTEGESARHPRSQPAP